jgi:hypothetical protein
VQVHASEVSALHVEAGIAEARSQMQAALREPGAAVDSGAIAGCPVHRSDSAPVGEDALAASAIPAERNRSEPSGDAAPSTGGCPVHTTLPAHPLNEVTAGVVQALGKKSV